MVTRLLAIAIIIYFIIVFCCAQDYAYVATCVEESCHCSTNDLICQYRLYMNYHMVQNLDELGLGKF